MNGLPEERKSGYAPSVKVRTGMSQEEKKIKVREYFRLYARERRKKYPEKYRESSNKWKREHKEQASESARQTRIKHPEIAVRNVNNYRKRYPERFKAAIIITKGLFKGKIKKPNSCSLCGDIKQSKDIHGHHMDYSKPSEVVWVCRKCHLKIHKDQENRYMEVGT